MAEPAVFAPDPEPEEIAEIASLLRERAGMPKGPGGAVADDGGSRIAAALRR